MLIWELLQILRGVEVSQGVGCLDPHLRALYEVGLGLGRGVGRGFEAASWLSAFVFHFALPSLGLCWARQWSSRTWGCFGYRVAAWSWAGAGAPATLS